MIYLVLNTSYNETEVLERQHFLNDTFGVYFRCNKLKYNILLFTSVPESFEDKFVFITGDTLRVSALLKSEYKHLKNKILSIDTCNVIKLPELSLYKTKKIFVSKNLNGPALLSDDTGYGFKISKTEMNLNKYASLPTIEKLKKTSYSLYNLRRDNYDK